LIHTFFIHKREFTMTGVLKFSIETTVSCRLKYFEDKIIKYRIIIIERQGVGIGCHYPARIGNNGPIRWMLVCEWINVLTNCPTGKDTASVSSIMCKSSITMDSYD